MDDDSADAAWHAQELCEREQFEQEQALLRADAGWTLWLDQLELEPAKELI